MKLGTAKTAKKREHVTKATNQHWLFSVAEYFTDRQYAPIARPLFDNIVEIRQAS